MKKKFNRALVIFRRDLRLEDNTALNYAVANATEIIPCFIFDPRQIEESNAYRSMNAMQFLTQSLTELAQECKKRGGEFYFFYGKPTAIIKDLLQELSIDAVFVNKDYTPFSVHRDAEIETICTKNDVQFHQLPDILLHEPEQVIAARKKPYLIFTPFYKFTSTLPITHPHPLPKKVGWYVKKIKNTEPLSILKTVMQGYHNTHIHSKGGRKEGLATLHSLRDFKKYEVTRDFPALETTHLSAALKFGTLSIREVFYAIVDSLGAHHTLLKQLFWRNFFSHTIAHRPDMLGHALKLKLDALPWNTDKKALERWQEGKTGFPIVDAGMRQLNATGFMHNRVRMIVASFLTKDLHISWQEGERYFAQHLVDYDPAVNNGNWQWSASTGIDAQPYFRIFNPWLQQKKFDHTCEYIKKWVPELKSVDPKNIHTWYKQKGGISGYPAPMVDHATESALAKATYKKIS